jgi:hypothetical protein
LAEIALVDALAARPHASFKRDTAYRRSRADDYGPPVAGDNDGPKPATSEQVAAWPGPQFDESGKRPARPSAGSVIPSVKNGATRRGSGPLATVLAVMAGLVAIVALFGK